MNADYRPADFAGMVDHLAERAVALAGGGQRTLLGVTGPPGAGKSTVCAALLGVIGSATVVGMDGFHLADDELDRLSRRNRKGAPDTFDVDGYVALLGRLRSQEAEVIYAPRFDRGLEESIGSAVPILRSTALVITEGNYLLTEHGGWEKVRPLLDEVWYLDVPEAVRTDRLIARQRSYGKSADDAHAWTEHVDVPNARVSARARDQADLVVVVPDI